MRVDITNDLTEGLKAYAQTQGDLQRVLNEHFRAIWQSSLTDSDDMSELDGNVEDNRHPDDDDEVEGDDLEGADSEGYEGVDIDDNNEDIEELG